MNTATESSTGTATDTTATAAPEAGTKRTKRSLSGRVTSTKMTNTVTVAIERKVKHGVYGKYLVHTTKVHAHTTESFNEGDLVEIVESRPISKTKSWVVTRLLQGAVKV